MDRLSEHPTSVDGLRYLQARNRSGARPMGHSPQGGSLQERRARNRSAARPFRPFDVARSLPSESSAIPRRANTAVRKWGRRHRKAVVVRGEDSERSSTPLQGGRASDMAVGSTRARTTRQTGGEAPAASQRFGVTRDLSAYPQLSFTYTKQAGLPDRPRHVRVSVREER